MKNLNLGKGKRILISLLPIFITLYLLFSMISISLIQIFLSLSLLCWILILIWEKQKFIFPSFFWPLLAYTVLSLVSSFLSVNPGASLKNSRELLLFLVVPLVYTGFSKEEGLKKANLAILASAYLSCLYSFFYFFFKASPGERIQGFMGNPMTQGGLLLLFSCMALSMLLFSRNRTRYLWGLGFLLSLFALVLTQTRNAWIGLVKRGIPALLAWLTFMFWAFVSLIKLPKNKDPILCSFTAAALAALAALATAGLFEYNFADSEITMLFLYMVTIPFSLARAKENRS